MLKVNENKNGASLLAMEGNLANYFLDE